MNQKEREIRLNIINDIINNKPNRLRESFLKRNYNEFYTEILEYSDKSISFKEKMWYWSKNLDPIKDTIRCIECGIVETTFHKNWLDGYRPFCSSKCSAINTGTMDKRKETVYNIYGVDNIAKSEHIKTITENTNRIRYDNKSSFQNKDVRLKWANTIQKNFGVDHIFKSETIKENIKNTKQIYYSSEKYAQLHIYPNKNELEIYSFLDSYNISYLRNNRTVLKGKELDVYIPDYNIAIEHNGIYWHSDSVIKDKNYHLNKTIKCSEQNIELLHIFESDWNDKRKREILKTMILNKTIYRHNNKSLFDIRDISIKDCRDFLSNNHINGFIGSTHKLGIYIDSELVSVMLFTIRCGKTYIVRYCNINSNCYLFDSLLKHFIDSDIYRYNSDIIYRSDKSLLSEYSKILEYSHSIRPNYMYVHNKNRYSKKKSDLDIDPKIYDCGKDVYIFRYVKD